MIIEFKRYRRTEDGTIVRSLHNIQPLPLITSPQPLWRVFALSCLRLLWRNKWPEFCGVSSLSRRVLHHDTICTNCLRPIQPGNKICRQKFLLSANWESKEVKRWTVKYCYGNHPFCRALKDLILEFVDRIEGLCCSLTSVSPFCFHSSGYC